MNLKNYSLFNIILWLIYPTVLLMIICLMLFTCCNKRTDTSMVDHSSSKTINNPHRFTMPPIPDSIKQPEQRAAYLAMHYWDNFDFGDTTYIHLPNITEQAFVNYLDILKHIAKDDAGIYINQMLDKTIEMDNTLVMYPYLLGLYKTYLYDPNSPMRDQEHYIPVTHYILKDTLSSWQVKERAKFELSMMLKNRKGQLATDIVYTTADGKTGSLHQLKKVYTLIYFYNPDCPVCKEVGDYMQVSSILNKLLIENRIDILAIYPDENISRWRAYATEIPKKWINGYDKQQRIRKDVLYDLNATPSLYLLDANKRVLLKDADMIAVETYLEQQNIL